jgi:hypothetical protein
MRFLGEILRDSDVEEEEVKGSTMFGEDGVIRPLDRAYRLCSENRV